MSDLQTSIVRTVVPMLVGVILTAAARVGLDLDDAAVTSIATAVVSAAYYAAARWLESRRASLGWLLGKPTAPSYPAR